jgi:hypothetical protein
MICRSGRRGGGGGGGYFKVESGTRMDSAAIQDFGSLLLLDRLGNEAEVRSVGPGLGRVGQDNRQRRLLLVRLTESVYSTHH